MKVCEICGATEEETRIIVSKKHNKTLCRKHNLQLTRHGKVYERTIYDPNIIREEKEFAFIELYDKKGEHIADTKIDIKMKDVCKEIKWYLRPNGYAFGTLNGKKIKLHNIVYDYFKKDRKSKGFIIDHIDGDPLNNTKENLRAVTHQENSQNMHKDGKTVGVNYSKWNGSYKWIPQIMVDGKGIWLGAYDTEEEAIKVRKEAEQKYFSINKR